MVVRGRSSDFHRLACDFVLRVIAKLLSNKYFNLNHIETVINEFFLSVDGATPAVMESAMPVTAWCCFPYEYLAIKR